MTQSISRQQILQWLSQSSEHAFWLLNTQLNETSSNWRLAAVKTWHLKRRKHSIWWCPLVLDFNQVLKGFCVIKIIFILNNVWFKIHCVVYKGQIFLKKYTRLHSYKHFYKTTTLEKVSNQIWSSACQWNEMAWSAGMGVRLMSVCLFLFGSQLT